MISAAIAYGDSRDTPALAWEWAEALDRMAAERAAPVDPEVSR